MTARDEMPSSPHLEVWPELSFVMVQVAEMSFHK